MCIKNEMIESRVKYIDVFKDRITVETIERVFCVNNQKIVNNPIIKVTLNKRMACSKPLF